MFREQVQYMNNTMALPKALLEISKTRLAVLPMATRPLM
jgi:hypothetical protein